MKRIFCSPKWIPLWSWAPSHLWASRLSRRRRQPWTSWEDQPKSAIQNCYKKTTNFVSFLSALMTLFIKCLTFVIPKGSLKSFGVISFPVKQSRKVGKKFTLFTTFKTRKYRKYKDIQSSNSNYKSKDKSLQLPDPWCCSRQHCQCFLYNMNNNSLCLISKEVRWVSSVSPKSQKRE